MTGTIGPLQGVVAIDLGQVYNGPYCTFLMAMAGATVIKIEPITGENLRRRAEVGGAALPFAMLNSNKRFAALNLKAPAGKQLLREMVAKGDVLIENFSPGAMDRLGLGYDALHAINPRLIYASGSGYGLSGPLRHLRSIGQRAGESDHAARADRDCSDAVALRETVVAEDPWKPHRVTTGLWGVVGLRREDRAMAKQFCIPIGRPDRPGDLILAPQIGVPFDSDAFHPFPAPDDIGGAAIVVELPAGLEFLSFQQNPGAVARAVL